jgi:hypothetical protein
MASNAVVLCLSHLPAFSALSQKRRTISLTPAAITSGEDDLKNSTAARLRMEILSVIASMQAPWVSFSLRAHT